MEKVIIREKPFRQRVFEKMKGIFLVEPTGFSSKRRINVRGIGRLGAIVLGLFCLGVILIPSPQRQIQNFHEQRPQAAANGTPARPDQAQEMGQAMSESAIHSYLQNRAGSSAGHGDRYATTARNTSMIISRDGDSSTTLPPGTKFWVKLSQNVTVTSRPIPVIGIILSSITNRSTLAIPEDSQIFGEASLDSESERASISWKSILFPDGRSKAFNAIALGADNQAGVEGRFRSDALKNTAGTMISRFIGGFAEGATHRGALGANPGGITNGLLQGAADTAKDRTESWSENLKKPREWIELEAGVRFQSILSQPFVFRDPGGIN